MSEVELQIKYIGEPKQVFPYYNWLLYIFVGGECVETRLLHTFVGVDIHIHYIVGYQYA